MYLKLVKPFLDIVTASILLILASPIILLIIAGLFVANKGNVFFFQLRPGKYGTIFKIVKFKTMSDFRDASGALLPDSKRITKVGSFVRSSSLDEIPQLINVLKGEMSFVGPRPLLPEYIQLYTSEQQKRHLVKPGITGWAQVNGRNAISWDKKLALDVWYVENQSFKLDFIILLKTVKKVFFKEGINMENEVTTSKFQGSLKND